MFDETTGYYSLVKLPQESDHHSYHELWKHGSNEKG